MDKEIVRRESATEPAEQSRLWSREDIKKVLQENKRLVNLTSLILDECDSLTEISDVSCLSNLEILSFRERRNLFRIHHSVGLLEKLKILDAEGCPELKSFPPLKLTSLESLDLSYCSNLESFPEILGKMENITRLHLIGFSIRKLPPSFRNLTRLKVLYVGTETTPLMDFDVATLISNICMMSELFEIAANSLQWRLWPDDACLQWRLWPDDFLKLTSLLNSSIEFLCHGDLSDELLRLFLSCFVNVINLELKGSKLTVIPECIKECRFLSTPKLNGCDRLQEIRGIPPNLKRFSAIACPDLTSSSISMLLNQELHEAGDTYFSLPIVKIPEWFECQIWEDFDIQLHDAIDKNLLLQEPLVVMLTLGKIKDATDEYPLSVQNNKFGSRLYVNADIAKIHQFRQRIIHDKGGSQSQSSQSNMVEKFLHNARVVSIGEINNLRQVNN
eukprot:XP_025981898.1 TMV resistance protein N-like [Glycine max]